jgi:hypothetical protein
VRQAKRLRVKIKNREKIEKSVDAVLAFPLEAAFHNLSAVASRPAVALCEGWLAEADPNSNHFITIHEKEIHFTISVF